jgi:hypothetical protein
MAVKKTSRKKTAKKAAAKKAPAKRSVAKRVAQGGISLRKKAGSTASKVVGKTKQIARGAQKVGKIVATIGDLVAEGGHAAEELTAKVETRGRKAPRKRTSR